jgi:hypothetical protein
MYWKMKTFSKHTWNTFFINYFKLIKNLNPAHRVSELEDCVRMAAWPWFRFPPILTLSKFALTFVWVFYTQFVQSLNSMRRSQVPSQRPTVQIYHEQSRRRNITDQNSFKILKPAILSLLDWGSMLWSEFSTIFCQFSAKKWCFL